MRMPLAASRAVPVLWLVALACSSVTLSAQQSFEATAAKLSSPDPGVRLQAVRLLKAAAYPEAAGPLVPLITDPDDAVQLEAIGAELNIFLAEKVVPRRRVGLVVEVRNAVAAEAAFARGRLALGARPVPASILTSLAAAARDDHPRVGLEALYAFGTLAGEPGGSARRDILRATGPGLATMIGAPDPALRVAVLRVIGRVFEHRPGDDPIEEALGDAVIGALNDGDRSVKVAAMDALGATRYARAVQGLTDLFRFYLRGDLAAAALGGLARIAHPSSAPLFAAQLTGRDTTLGRIAIEAFARLGDKSKLPDVQAALAGDSSEATALAASFAAAMLSSVPLDPLVEALNRPQSRDQALGYLIAAAPGRTTAFSRYAQDPEPRLRADIADILGVAGDATALSIVEPMLADRDPQAARAAARAVARLRAAARPTL